MNKKIPALILSLFIITICNISTVNSTNPLLDDTRGEVILWESFEEAFPPENWTNDGWLWSYYGEPYHGYEWAYSWAAGDVLTTPSLDFEFNSTLTFWYLNEAFTHPQDIEVWVDGQTIWWDYGYSFHEYHMETIDLSDYFGQHTISFVGMTSEMYGQSLDAITVTTVPVEVNQSIFDHGFPIRHAIDGDWAAAQSFTSMNDTLYGAQLYIRKFGTPEFNLTVELRENNPQGTLLDALIFIPDEVPSDWEWFNLDFIDISVTPDTDYFIVCPPAPSGVTTSFGYEWGYAFGNQYDPGSFWFTRDGGGLWRGLPTMYEFVFRTYGYS